MKFEKFLEHFKKYSRIKMSFSQDFINEFIENGFELFLFHTQQENDKNANSTDVFFKTEKKFYTHDNLQDLKSKILYYNNAYPLVIYFTYEPKKSFYISKKICESADNFSILPNLYEDDDSINFVAGFNLDKQFEFESIWQLITFHGLTTGIIGFKIYRVDIIKVHDMCKFKNVNLKYNSNLTHFCGNSIRRDKPYEIVEARHAIEQIMLKNDFENELDLLLSLSEYIMKPIQQQYQKMDEFIDALKLDSLYNKKEINDYCNKIYAQLVKDKAIPTKWKHEYQMFELIISIYQDARYQYYADWISPQNYDVYVPSIKTAFEFQGLQHYEIVEFFGGEASFIKRQKLDERKKLVSAQNGIKLIEWRYDEPITLKTLNQKIK